jgi:hypothetical protein
VGGFGAENDTTRLSSRAHERSPALAQAEEAAPSTLRALPRAARRARASPRVALPHKWRRHDGGWRSPWLRALRRPTSCFDPPDVTTGERAVGVRPRERVTRAPDLAVPGREDVTRERQGVSKHRPVALRRRDLVSRERDLVPWRHEVVTPARERVLGPRDRVRREHRAALDDHDVVMKRPRHRDPSITTS